MSEHDKTNQELVKVVPDLTDLRKNKWFTDVYDAHKTSELQKKLDDLGVPYLSSDSKSVLTWRYLDAINGIVDDNQEVDIKTELDPTPAKEIISEPEMIDTISPKSSKERLKPILVLNKHNRDILEPSTSTFLRSNKQVSVYPTKYVTREQILKNLNCLIEIHGDVLVIKA